MILLRMAIVILYPNIPCIWHINACYPTLRWFQGVNIRLHSDAYHTWSVRKKRKAKMMGDGLDKSWTRASPS